MITATMSIMQLPLQHLLTAAMSWVACSFVRFSLLYDAHLDGKASAASNTKQQKTSVLQGIRRKIVCCDED
jgi:hypothetical protein